MKKPGGLNPKLSTYLERDHHVHGIPNMPDISLPQMTGHADPRELWGPESHALGPSKSQVPTD